MHENENPMRTEATKKLFTVDEYYKITGAGVFSERVRTELIEGEIIEMSGMGVAHAMAITRATRLFSRVFEEKVEVRVQLPLPLSRFSEVEPDLCLVDARRPAIDIHHPEPSDVFLVVEISDSSLRYDRDVKLPVYAAAGVSEVWIEDLPNQTLHVYREPFGKVYKVALRYQPGDSVSPLAFPETSFSVSDLVRPIRS
jgi:Uma2 family endonuclease